MKIDWKKFEKKCDCCDKGVPLKGLQKLIVYISLKLGLNAEELAIAINRKRVQRTINHRKH